MARGLAGTTPHAANQDTVVDYQATVHEGAYAPTLCLRLYISFQAAESASAGRGDADQWCQRAKALGRQTADKHLYRPQWVMLAIIRRVLF